MEPKKELVERVVKVIGTKKAIELLSETATIEQSGGLYTVVRVCHLNTFDSLASFVWQQRVVITYSYKAIKIY